MYEPQPNELAERCAQTVKGMFKTPRSALKIWIGGPVPDNHRSEHGWCESPHVSTTGTTLVTTVGCPGRVAGCLCS